jgi:transcriptional regulator with XRE-family HTH domain
MRFGEKVRGQREKLGLSQGELAELLGVSRWTVVNYERGGSHPKDRKIYYKLAEIFDMDVNYFLTENEEFLSIVGEKYGKRGLDQAGVVLEQAAALFAGGELSDKDKLAFMNTMQEIFLKSKEVARAKYTPKRYRVDGAGDDTE